MNRILVVAALIITASSLITGVATGQTNAKKASGNTEQAIRQLVTELDNAQQQYDTATLDRIWADDLTFTNPAGEVLTKGRASGQ